MGAFVGRAPVRVAVVERPDEWIEIKAKLSVGDRGRLTDAVMSVSSGNDGQADVALHAGQYQLALLQAAVCDWRLKDEDGGFVPFNRERIADLDMDDALVDKALGEIAARNPLGGKGIGPTDTKGG
jgi:hypothetical protein